MKLSSTLALGFFSILMGVGFLVVLKKELRYDELLKLYGKSAEAKVINVEVSGGSFNRYKSGVSFCTFQLRDIETSQVFIRSGECPSNTSETRFSQLSS